MCINEDLKAAIIRPTKSHLHKTSLFFKYRIASYKNLVRQLFPEKISKDITTTRTILDKSMEAQHKENDIKKMCMEITIKRLLPLQLQSNRGIVNTFSSQKVTPEQSKDMLTFHEIGMQAYEQYVIHRILQSPSFFKKTLLTMARRKMSRKRVSQKEEESRQVAKCL